VQYVGIDWAYRRAAWCAMRGGGDIADEGLVPADEDGLARLVSGLVPDVRAWVGPGACSSSVANAAVPFVETPAFRRGECPAVVTVPSKRESKARREQGYWGVGGSPHARRRDRSWPHATGTNRPPLAGAPAGPGAPVRGRGQAVTGA
jgi:hypothetical protein